MQKTLFIIGLAAALSGCGGDDKSGDNCRSADIVIKGDRSQRTINQSGKSVSICGDRNAITIAADLTALYIRGNRNIFYIADGVKIDSCIIDGERNTATANNKNFTCSGSGSRNTGF